MIVKNTNARVVTISSHVIKPNSVVDLGDELKDHKGVKMALSKGWLVESDAKELKAFTDPEGAKADAEAAKKEKK